MYTYSLITDCNLILRSDGARIPPDPANIDYQAYLAWVDAGGVATLALSDAQSKQIIALSIAYQNAIVQPISYTSKGGVTQTYQADANSINNLSSMLLAFQSTQTVPDGFYWLSEDNTQVPFTYADMQALAQAIGTQANAAFHTLQTLKAQVRAATTADQVQAITWPAT